MFWPALSFNLDYHHDCTNNHLTSSPTCADVRYNTQCTWNPSPFHPNYEEEGCRPWRSFDKDPRRKSWCTLRVFFFESVPFKVPSMDRKSPSVYSELPMNWPCILSPFSPSKIAYRHIVKRSVFIATGRSSISLSSSPMKHIKLEKE